MEMVIPGERIEEEGGSEYTDDTDTDSVTSASIRDIGESTLDSDILSPEPSTRSAAGQSTILQRLWSNVSSRRYKVVGSTTVRNELVNVLDALFRLKQLTCKEYTDITAPLAASF